jgi:hypothetical protein
MVDEQNSQIELSLEIAKVRKELRHFRGVIFIRRVKPDQGIEQKKPRANPLGGFQEPAAIPARVQPKARRRDHVEIKAG